jgi:RNA 2',3'-cyclic 3'-phosphodiesterase
VAKERLGSPRARLFVALDLPDGIMSDLVAWQERELRDPVLRPVAPQALHVTLCFLGHHPERAIERVAAVVEGIEPVSIGMRLEAEPVAVPRGRPRLFAANAPSEAAVDLQGELSSRLEADRLYKPEKRPFWSHVTLSRVRPERGAGGRRRARPRLVATPPGPLPELLLEPFDCVRVTLYRSYLRSAGAEYVPLASLDLPPTEAEKR